MRSAIRKPPICAGVACAVHDVADDLGHLGARQVAACRAHDAIARAIATRPSTGAASSQEVREQLLAVGGQDRLGVELHALAPASSRWRTPMISSSQVFARDLERRRAATPARRRASGSASPTNGFGRPANRPFSSWKIFEVLPCMTLRRAHDLAAERLADRLMAEAHAEDRDLARERADRRPARCRPRSACTGPGEITIASGASSPIVVDGDRVVALDARRPRPARRGTARGCR